MSDKVISVMISAAAFFFMAFPSYAEAQKLNLNTADAEALTALPEITSELAENILQYRENVGSFESLKELSEVPGMTTEVFEKVKPFLTLDSFKMKPNC